MSTSQSLVTSLKTLHLAVSNGIANIKLDNAPVNALSGTMIKELKQVLGDLTSRKDVKVILFESANPDFFIAHVDINILGEQELMEELEQTAPEGLNLFQAVGEMLRTQPQVTIVKLQGIARAGGAEFVAAADLSFAALEKGKLGQSEALMGITPGGGATQYLSARMTRGRALEVILGADLFDAATAERYGWINRALPDDKLDAFVERLASNIVALPDGVIETVKKVLPAERNIAGFKAENDGWATLAFEPRTAQVMQQVMEQGAQTVEGEMRIEELLRNLPVLQ